MVILSLDTTTRAGSAAVLRDDAVLCERVGDSSIAHGERLPGDLARVLETAGVSLREVELFAVAAGPGSFTGLRVGIATVQGLAMASGSRIVPISTLEALARAGRDGGRLVGAWMDAQRGEVYAALYEADGERVRVAPVAAKPQAVLDAWTDAVGTHDMVFIGDGATRYADLIQRRHGARVAVTPAPPLAGFVGQIAAGRAGQAVLPHAVVPIYVRKSDAELARDRRAGA